ncbi:MAG: hypothetical protein MUO87_03915, partial [Thermoplasmata archaeon]|nr:hypothetical protein [Thermoplasmata archaeon]
EQLIMVDSAQNNGVPVIPIQPNPLAYWNTCSEAGLSLVDPMPDTGRDLATFLTYKYDYDLSETDTLHYWTVMTTTPMGGSLAELTAQVAYAKNWYTLTVRECNPSCCEERVGDANGIGVYPESDVSLGDIMLMVDVLFISNDCTKLACPEEADVNQSGGANPLQSACLDYVSLGDIMTLVDFLFITGPETAVLNTCL